MIRQKTLFPSISRVCTALALAALAALPVGCGTATMAVCGNGVKEDGEDCDKGPDNGAATSSCNAECRSISVVIPQVQVQWSILRKSDVDGYNGAACADIGAQTARVQIAGPANADVMIDCSTRTRVFADKLPAGKYQATVTLLDEGGKAVTQPRSAPAVQVNPGPAVQIAIDFALTDLIKPCKGSLRIFPAWGATSAWCTVATPMVDQQTYLVTKQGEKDPLFGVKAESGTPLDGSAKAACFTPRNSGLTPDNATDLDCGAYDVRIEGFAKGARAFCGAFPVYVGPGSNSMPWRLVMPPEADGACK